MKPVLYTALLLILASTFLAAQTSGPYRVVFDLTSRDSLDQKGVLRWIREITEENPKAELEVVMYGKGFELVMPDRSAYPADVQKAMANPNVSFKACSIALKNNKVDKAQLMPGALTVVDGIYEIFLKQRDGWGYIKVGH
jgi:intracellular sulfur oxidation DsrE/DsrF family protein